MEGSRAAIRKISGIYLIIGIICTIIGFIVPFYLIFGPCVILIGVFGLKGSQKEDAIGSLMKAGIILSLILFIVVSAFFVIMIIGTNMQQGIARTELPVFFWIMIVFMMAISLIYFLAGRYLYKRY